MAVDPGGTAGRLFRAAKGTDWKSKAKGVAASLKAEYEAGKRGDDTPAAPIWASPKEQLESLVALFRSGDQTSGDDASTDEVHDDDDGTSAAKGTTNDDIATDEAETVADVMRSVDWASVRAATAERTGDATKAMKSMADHVDWAKVQPVAAQVSSALIAALATGQLGVGGRLATTVARAVTDQGGLGQRVAAQLAATPSSVPTDLRPTIEAASREV